MKNQVILVNDIIQVQRIHKQTFHIIHDKPEYEVKEIIQ